MMFNKEDYAVLKSGDDSIIYTIVDFIGSSAELTYRSGASIVHGGFCPTSLLEAPTRFQLLRDGVKINE